MMGTVARAARASRNQERLASSSSSSNHAQTRRRRHATRGRGPEAKEKARARVRGSACDGEVCDWQSTCAEVSGRCTRAVDGRDWSWRGFWLPSLMLLMSPIGIQQQQQRGQHRANDTPRRRATRTAQGQEDMHVQMRIFERQQRQPQQRASEKGSSAENSMCGFGLG